MRNPRRLLVYIGVTVIAVVAVLLIFWAYGTCQFRSATFGDKYGCYVQRILSISDEGGAASALEYVRYVVYPDNGYAMVHVLLHTVGDLAYTEDPDIMHLIEYLKPYIPLIQQTEYYNGFDGFIHGYVTEYLQAQKDAIPVTMHRLCAGETKIPGIPIPMNECYHMLGHAVMHATENVLSRALGYCDTAAKEKDALTGCYYGVFMENSFLYDPHYHAGSPRPDSIGMSMLDLCSQFTGQKATSCDTFVGESHFVVRPDDIAGAFHECSLLKINEGVCIERLAGVLVASLSHNPSDAIGMCNSYADPSFVANCVAAAKTSLESGFGIPADVSIPLKMLGMFESLRLSTVIVLHDAHLMR